MSLRARLALTILLAGLATALALIFTVATAFQRFRGYFMPGNLAQGGYRA